MTWINAWLAAQRELAAGRRPAAGLDAARQLAAFGADYAAVAAGYLQSAGRPAGPDAMREAFADRYLRLFTPPASIPGGAANARWQAAMQRCGELAVAIALDASQRLSVELANPDPAAAPVTSLRQLHGLWVECGEAAWAAAAHREDFSEAQAELLASLVELGFEGQR